MRSWQGWIGLVVGVFGLWGVGCPADKTEEQAKESVVEGSAEKEAGGADSPRAESPKESDAGVPESKPEASTETGGEVSREAQAEGHPESAKEATPERLVTAGPTLEGCPVFPSDNPWNTDISKEPVDPRSQAILQTIGLDTTLHPDFGTVWEGAPIGIPYVVVDATQAKVPISFEYASESDPGPYPIPPNPPIEGGPQATGDRHILVFQRGTCLLYEVFYAFPDGSGWKGGSGAIFDLRSNRRRPERWTSADAAGLPIFPGLVRYDEVEAGEIKHALRFTVSRSRQAYVHPATHWASSRTESDLPPMGMRVRLKASVDLSTYTPRLQVILRAMKTYGMFVADNGSNWFVSGAPDPRWNDTELRGLKRLRGRDFEVVQMGKIYTPADFP